MRGRKRTPHHLKLVKGNPGRRPVGAPPAAVEGEVEMPRLLSTGSASHMDRARELWREKSPVLIRLAILNPITATQFGNWCEMQARFESAPADFNASMLSQLRALGACYGMDYIAWEKVSAGKGEEKRDPAEGFFAA